jgi:replication-associated recombination protein RarA
VVLIGATTENPYYEVNAALVSRMRVLQLQSLDPGEITALIERAITDDRGLGGDAVVTPEAREAIARLSGGDARYGLNLLEASVGLAGDSPVTPEIVERAGGGRPSRTTRMATSTTTWRRRSSSRCAGATPTPRCTGWPSCSRAARTRSSSHAA